MTTTQPADEDFEALYRRLDEVATRLEAGNLPLDQSIELYEEGMRLAQQCQALLTNVEQRIETLRGAYEDGFTR